MIKRIIRRKHQKNIFRLIKSKYNKNMVEDENQNKKSDNKKIEYICSNR